MSAMLQTGVQEILERIPPNSRDSAKDSFSTSLVFTFYTFLALSATSAVGTISVKWVLMRTPRTEDASLPSLVLEIAENGGENDVEPAAAERGRRALLACTPSS